MEAAPHEHEEQTKRHEPDAGTDRVAFSAKVSSHPVRTEITASVMDASNRSSRAGWGGRGNR